MSHSSIKSLPIKLVHSSAKLPERQFADDAGADLYAVSKVYGLSKQFSACKTKIGAVTADLTFTGDLGDLSEMQQKIAKKYDLACISELIADPTQVLSLTCVDIADIIGKRVKTGYADTIDLLPDAVTDHELFKFVYDDLAKRTSNTVTFTIQIDNHSWDITIYIDDMTEYIKYVQYDTGLQIAIPYGFEGQIRPRSSVRKYDMKLCNPPGTIDASYRGNVMCMFEPSYGIDRKHYNVGDKICQLVIAPVELNAFHIVDELPEPSSTRGSGGFGHTGQ